MSSRARASSDIAVNSTPMPRPGCELRTMARALTSPLGTSNTSRTIVPSGGGSGVEMKIPPIPKVETRETVRRPLPCHATSIPFGSPSRE